MKLSIKKIYCSIIMFLLLLFVQTVVHAQPIMVPGFMGIESSYMSVATEGAETGNAYFTISNFHSEPIVLLSASSDIFGNATFISPNNDELEQVIIEPGSRLEMAPNSVHLQLEDVDSSKVTGHFQELTLLVRRGLEPLEEVEAIEADANAGQTAQEAGIPNEHRFDVSVPLRN